MWDQLISEHDMESRLQGTTIYGYRLEEQIGAGGMATVWRAVHPSLGKTAAIKVLEEQYARDESLVERFLTEARIQYEVSHEHIVHVENVCESPPAIVMELVEGCRCRRPSAASGARSPWSVRCQ